LKKPLPKYQLLINSISNPLMVGCYLDGELIDSTTSSEKTSNILLPIIKEYLDRYDISRISYANGPGSYMAIKITYVMLKSIEIISGIKCVGCSAFELNGNKPIKAIGSLYFIKEKETIITKKLDEVVDSEFVLPKTIHNLVLDKESIPNYMLPAV